MKPFFYSISASFFIVGFWWIHPGLGCLAISAVSFIIALQSKEVFPE